MKTNPQRPQRLFVQPVRYEIPAFQRRYVWKQEEQWEPLWDDVEELAQSIIAEGRTEPHFMGAVVLQQTQFPTATIERRIVVDGQQRLTTLQLLIDAVQEVLQDQEHSSPAKRLSALVTNGEEYLNGNSDHAFKVWPTTVDRDAFRHAMSNELAATNYASSRIVQAHEYFKAQAQQWLDRFPRDTGERDNRSFGTGGGRKPQSRDRCHRPWGIRRPTHHFRDVERARHSPAPVRHGQEQGIARDGHRNHRRWGSKPRGARDLAVRPRRMVGQGSRQGSPTEATGRRIPQSLAYAPKPS